MTINPLSDRLMEMDFKSQVLDWDRKWQDCFRSFVQFQLATADGAHDLAHVQRVVINARTLLELEPAEPEVVLAAAWLHDCVLVPKDSPARGQASRLAAQRATEFLAEQHYPVQWIPAIVHAIEAHSFTAGIHPQTIEARIVQDADRLDALGAIGIARCFMTAGSMQGALHAPVDPLARHRPLEDRRYAVDHFFQKLLKLPSQMQTESGRNLAAERARFLLHYLRQMAAEAGWDPTALEDRWLSPNAVAGPNLPA